MGADLTPPAVRDAHARLRDACAQMEEDYPELRLTPEVRAALLEVPRVMASYPVIERERFRAISLNGEPVPMRVMASPSLVDVESAEDGMAQVSVYVRDDGVDVRVGDLQLVVKFKHVVLLQAHRSASDPVAKWSLLFEGDMAGPPDA